MISHTGIALNITHAQSDTDTTIKLFLLECDVISRVNRFRDIINCNVICILYTEVRITVEKMDSFFSKKRCPKTDAGCGLVTPH